MQVLLLSSSYEVSLDLQLLVSNLADSFQSAGWLRSTKSFSMHLIKYRSTITQPKKLSDSGEDGNWLMISDILTVIGVIHGRGQPQIVTEGMSKVQITWENTTMDILGVYAPYTGHPEAVDFWDTACTKYTRVSASATILIGDFNIPLSKHQHPSFERSSTLRRTAHQAMQKWEVNQLTRNLQHTSRMEPATTSFSIDYMGIQCF
ncbi:hypothetical protein Pelo_12109 [Pelomyxa schiedti]|nr:hypothetical protein Pelo_12109 [Pelomyxa schiedti]